MNRPIVWKRRAQSVTDTWRDSGKRVRNGEQWDKPNGWAPLQWMAIQDLKCTAMTFWVMKSRAAG